MCRDLVVHNGYFVTCVTKYFVTCVTKKTQDVSLSPVALVRGCAESSNSKITYKCFFAFKGHLHLLEDF